MRSSGPPDLVDITGSPNDWASNIDNPNDSVELTEHKQLDLDILKIVSSLDSSPRSETFFLKLCLVIKSLHCLYRYPFPIIVK